ncbi:MAG: Inositol monophosphatase family protein [Candidatus Berkelbacteria bacterium]|nr:Inositol monophosphatase family protein [Candidatus Berkelbacteria bacterium]
MNPEIINPEIKEPNPLAKQFIAKALEIGEVLKQRQREGLAIEHKNEDEFDPVTNADKEADVMWREFIQANFPDDLVLSEESDDIPTNYGEKRVWMIDPLDSTKAYIKGEDGYSVLVGMMQGNEILFGLAYAPARNQLFYAEKGQGAFQRQEDGTFKQIHVSEVADLAEAKVIVRDAGAKDKRPLDEGLESLPFKDFIRDSCMRVGRVADGEAEAQVNTNFRASKWDTLGPQLIVEEAGGVMSDIDGNPLNYHQEGLRWERSFMSANNPEIQKKIVAEISRAKL